MERRNHGGFQIPHRCARWGTGRLSVPDCIGTTGALLRPPAIREPCPSGMALREGPKDLIGHMGAIIAEMLALSGTEEESAAAV
jgi:hypothetical protein